MLTTLWIAVLVFTVPGLVVSWVSGLKVPWAIAASIPATFGIYGLSAWLLGLWEMRFDLHSVVISTLVFAAVALVWRLFFVGGWLVRRRKARIRRQTLADEEPAENAEVSAGEPAESSTNEAAESESETSERRGIWRVIFDYMRDGGILDHRWLLPAAGAITGAWLIIDRAVDLLLSTEHGLGDIVQGWDVHWHASTVRFIDETGIASSTMMGQLRNIETQQDLFYPSAWHAGAWVLSDVGNLTIVEATNLTGIVLNTLFY